MQQPQTSLSFWNAASVAARSRSPQAGLVTSVSVHETSVLSICSDYGWSDKRQIRESRLRSAGKKSRRGIGEALRDEVVDKPLDMRTENGRFAEALHRHDASARRLNLHVEVHTKGEPQPIRLQPPVENVYA